MKIIDFLLLIPVAAWGIYALYAITRGKVRCGGCSGDCAHCAAACRKSASVDSQPQEKRK